MPLFHSYYGLIQQVHLWGYGNSFSNVWFFFQLFISEQSLISWKCSSFFFKFLLLSRLWFLLWPGIKILYLSQTDQLRPWSNFFNWFHYTAYFLFEILIFDLLLIIYMYFRLVTLNFSPLWRTQTSPARINHKGIFMRFFFFRKVYLENTGKLQFLS